jgi:hypothetical protein
MVAALFTVGLSGVAAAAREAVTSASVIVALITALGPGIVAGLLTLARRDGKRRAEQLARIEAAVERLDARAHEMGERVARVEGALFPQHTRSGDNQ